LVLGLGQSRVPGALLALPLRLGRLRRPRLSRFLVHILLLVLLRVELVLLVAVGALSGLHLLLEALPVLARLVVAGLGLVLWGEVSVLRLRALLLVRELLWLAVGLVLI
jgi:hypothetical protein